MGNTDQFTNGGRPSFIDNTFAGTGDAALNAQGIGTFLDDGVPGHRLGHLTCLQRSSRAADGRPIHIRNDGAGFDNIDVPDGSNQPKLHFVELHPTADFFTTMRINQGAGERLGSSGIDHAPASLEIAPPGLAPELSPYRAQTTRR